jgi:small subunit ribosomal protein S10
MATPKQQKKKPTEKIRIRLKSFDHRMLDASVNDIVEKAKMSGTVVVGPVPLKTKCERFTILRSPHVDKKSRDQYELRTHVRMLELIEPNATLIDRLMHLELPAGVDVQIKL